MRINIEQPLILLLIPAAILLLIFSARFMHLRSRELKIKQLILRGLVFSLLITALSGVSLLKKGNSIATVFIVDSSDSTREQAAHITEFVNSAIKTKSDQDYVGVVSVGKNTNVENFVSDKCVYRGAQTGIDPSATNLQDAVNLALSLMPEGYAKRIVIISDGAENIGSLKDTAADIAMAGCDVKTYTLPSSTSSEVYVSNLTVPESVGTGEIFKVMVEVESNVSTTAVVSLYQGRTLTERKTVNLSKGTSLIPFYDTQTDSGLKTYRVTVEAADDTVSLNNDYSSFTNISKKNPVLIVEGDADEGDNLYNMLTSIGIDCRKVLSFNAPDTISEMLEYSCMILCNVSAKDLPEGFLKNLETYVKDHGKGLVACGGRNAFALGMYKNTVLETVLPVEMDINGEAEIPSMAIQFVIDKSGSMDGGKLDDAKRALIASLDTLRPVDSVGVIAFDQTVDKVVRMTPIGEDLSKLKTSMGTIHIAGGTSIYPAVREATTELLGYDATIKHIILLTDGQDTNTGYNDIIKKINDNNITLSSIALGNDCNTDLLRYLSESTGGRMYKVTDNKDLPKIFTQEIYLSQNEYLVDRPGPVYITSSDEIIKEVAASGVPDIRAYVATTLKARATELLETEDQYPLLSYWQYGLGKTFAWASDVTGNWSGDYFAWENNSLLWNNIIQTATSNNTRKGSYATVTQDLSSAQISYHTDEFSSSTTVTATITNDSGENIKIDMLPKAPGEFVSDFELTNEGVFSIAIKQYDNGEVTSGLTTAAIKKYSPEYTFNSDAGLLGEYARLTGGTEITSPAQVFTNNIHLIKAMKDITVPILVAALLLFILDIAYRRFRFRVVPEDFWSQLFARKKVKEVKKAPVTAAATTATAPAPSSSKDSGTKPDSIKGKKAEKKKNEPDIIDTSLLLNRMKK
ncbi:MAG: VWA domain-containing protein [Lachnospiraceae bacterium]|nr:VWA domain-containing protein [Lachnospiraceae bacterium]